MKRLIPVTAIPMSILAGSIALAGIVSLGGCREHRDSPTEPRWHPTPTPTPTPPISLTGQLVGDMVHGPGNELAVDVCGCVTAQMTLEVNDLAPVPLPCSASPDLPQGVPEIRIAIRTASWSVQKVFQVPLDPHIGLRAEANCLPPAPRRK